LRGSISSRFAVFYTVESRAQARHNTRPY